MATMLRASRFTRWPSTVISPASYDSRPLTQRSSVDLPEPDGPITQTTSPWLTSSEIPSSTRLLPNDFRTPRIAIISHPARGCSRTTCERRGSRSFPSEFLFEATDQENQRHAHYEVPHRHQRENLGVLERRRRDQPALKGELGHRDDRGLRRVLQQHDAGVAVWRQRDLERLRQYHAPEDECAAHAERLGSFHLSRIDRLDSGAKHLRHVTGVRKTKADDARLERRELDADFRKDEVDVEELDQDGDAADGVDQHLGETGQRTHLRHPHQRPHQTEEGGHDERARKDLDRDQRTLCQQRQVFREVVASEHGWLAQLPL